MLNLAAETITVENIDNEVMNVFSVNNIGYIYPEQIVGELTVPQFKTSTLFTLSYGLAHEAENPAEMIRNFLYFAETYPIDFEKYDRRNLWKYIDLDKYQYYVTIFSIDSEENNLYGKCNAAVITRSRLILKERVG